MVYGHYSPLVRLLCSTGHSCGWPNSKRMLGSLGRCTEGPALWTRTSSTWSNSRGWGTWTYSVCLRRGAIQKWLQALMVKAQRSFETNISLVLQLLGKKIGLHINSWGTVLMAVPQPCQPDRRVSSQPTIIQSVVPEFSQSDNFILKLENNSNYLQVPTEELAQCSWHPKGVNAITRNNINRHELKAVSFHRPHLEKISFCMISLALLGLSIELLQHHFVLCK